MRCVFFNAKNVVNILSVAPVLRHKSRSLSAILMTPGLLFARKRTLLALLFAYMQPAGKIGHAGGCGYGFG